MRRRPFVPAGRLRRSTWAGRLPGRRDEVGDGRVLGPGHRLEVPVHAVHPGLGFGREDSQRRRRSLGSPQRELSARAVARDPDPVILALDEVERPAALQRKRGAVVAADHRHRKVVDVHLLVVPGTPGVVAAVRLIADLQVGGPGHRYRARPAHEPECGVNYVHADVDEGAAAVERLGVEGALGAGREAPTTVPGRADEIHLAQFAALDALLEGDSLGNEPGLKVDGEDPVSRLSRVDHLARVGGIQRQRLLAEHVLAGRQRRQGGGMVDGVGGADADRVDRVELQ